MRLILTAAFIILATSFASPASAQSSGCDTAKSTAETIDCLNRHKKVVQDNLQKTYDQILQKAGEDAEWRASLAEAQTSWLAFRVKECVWEAARAESPALEKLYNISCVNRLTEQRIEDLSNILSRYDENAGPPEFGPTPRWHNVLANDYPDIYWRHRNLLSADLNCDGQNEQIIPGVRVNVATKTATTKAREQNEEQAQENLPVNVTALIAVAQNPVTGRPRVKAIELPVLSGTSEGNAPHLCTTDMRLTLVDYPESDVDEGEKSLPASPLCTSALQVSDTKCPPILIHWNGTSYDVTQTGKAGQ